MIVKCKDNYYYFVTYFNEGNPEQQKERFNSEEEAKARYEELIQNDENIQVELVYPEAPMPKAEKNTVYATLRRFNGFSGENDYSIEDLLKALEEADFKPYVEEIVGYEDVPSGKVKRYILKFQGYKNHFLVEFYRDADYKTTETNFYFTDSLTEDSEMIIDIDYSQEAEDLEEATLDIKEAVNEKVIEKPFDKFAEEMKRRLENAQDKEHELNKILDEIDEYCANNNIEIEQQEQLEDDLWEITKKYF